MLGRMKSTVLWFNAARGVMLGCVVWRAGVAKAAIKGRHPRVGDRVQQVSPGCGQHLELEGLLSPV